MVERQAATLNFGSQSDLPGAIVTRKGTQLIAGEGSQRPDPWKIEPFDRIEKIQKLFTVQVLDDFKNLIRLLDADIRHGPMKGTSGYPGKPLVGEQQISRRDSTSFY
jgi:hypothetical protein